MMDAVMHEGWFQPMGLTLHLQTNSRPILRAAGRAFGGFGEATPTDSPAMRLHLLQHALDDGQRGRPVFRIDNGLLYQTTGRDSTLVVDTERGYGFGYFAPTTIADEPFFRWHFLELGCFVMLTRRGLMGVHGAAVVKNGRAILLRAASGGGKTTLAFAAARRDFQALAEDVVWLEVASGRWWGMPWAFHLLPDARQLFPELAPYQPVLQTNGEHKLEVNLESLRPHSTVTQAQPGPVVLVTRHPGGRSRLRRLTLAEAKPLWLTGAAGNEIDFPNYHHHVDRLLQDNAYQLDFGDDIDAAVSLLAGLVSA